MSINIIKALERAGFKSECHEIILTKEMRKMSKDVHNFLKEKRKLEIKSRDINMMFD